MFSISNSFHVIHCVIYLMLSLFIVLLFVITVHYFNINFVKCVIIDTSCLSSVLMTLYLVIITLIVSLIIAAA